MSSVVEWLESPDGLEWSYGHFSMDPSDRHDMIEIINDYAHFAVAGHASTSSEEMLEYMKEEPAHIWADLAWTPDQPPDSV